MQLRTRSPRPTESRLSSASGIPSVREAHGTMRQGDHVELVAAPEVRRERPMADLFWLQGEVMKPLQTEHRIGQTELPPKQIELCPRCRGGLVYRPQPDVVYCYRCGGIEPGDVGIIYLPSCIAPRKFGHRVLTVWTCPAGHEFLGPALAPRKRLNCTAYVPETDSLCEIPCPGKSPRKTFVEVLDDDRDRTRMPKGRTSRAVRADSRSGKRRSPRRR